LLLVLYGCETLSLTLREDYKLQMFWNKVLKRIFGPKKDEVSNLGCYITRHFVMYMGHLIFLG
jgi:hypothetical protein